MRNFLTEVKPLAVIPLKLSELFGGRVRSRDESLVKDAIPLMKSGS